MILEKENIELEKYKGLSEDKLEEIFNEYIKTFITDKSQRREREKSVLIEKIKILTKNKDILIENSIL